MRTRNSYFPNNSSVTILRRRNKRRTPNVVEPELRTIVEVAPMADNQAMEELLQAPTKGYGDAIIILKIIADHFEIKTNLLQLVQANPYHGFERENHHTHINNFIKITSTLKFMDASNDVIKLMMFSYSLERAARVWLLTPYISLRDKDMQESKDPQVSISPQVVSTAKLPILNPNEFDLWKMRIEQYFLMSDYSLWVVILNDDFSIPTRVIDGVVQPVAPTNAEQRLDRKNELKARGTLLMALPDKHQLKFNIHKDAKTSMEAIEK
nr:reverse transcriptase domain-containing protein [Tanacetum cinerariifolium]